MKAICLTSFCLYCFEPSVLLDWSVNFSLRNTLARFAFFLTKAIFDSDSSVEVGIGFFFLCLASDSTLAVDFYKTHILKPIKASAYIN